MKKYLLLTLLTFGLRHFAIGQADCGSLSINEAENGYNLGRFSESIKVLKQCLGSGGFNSNEKVQAYRLIAMSYLEMDSNRQAEDNIEKLLRLKDNFETDFRDPDRFRLQVKYVRMQMRANLISSVSKKAEKIELAPATVQVITADDIRNRGYQDVEAIFADLPGFDVSRSFGVSYSVLFQRGYRSAGNTERTLLLVDGVEDNEMWTNAAFISKQLPVSNIKRIEIIYGPASTIYGANAFTGVINIVTKGGDDFLNKKKISGNGSTTKTFSAHAQGGYGAYNTKYADVTTYLQSSDVSFTVTGRLYQSDGMDLSKDPSWDGNWSAADFAPNIYNTNFTTTKKDATLTSLKKYDPTGKYYTYDSVKNKILPTAAAITKADSLDKEGKKVPKNVKAATFASPIYDVYLSAKLTVGDFRMGGEYFNKSEGSAGDFNDKYFAVNSDWTHWQVKQFHYYLKYDKKLSDKFTLSSFTTFRYSSFGNKSYYYLLKSYANNSLTLVDLVQNKLPSYSPQFPTQQSNEVRSELKGYYVFNDKFDFVGGLEFRNSLMQSDYMISLVPDPIINGVGKDSVKGGTHINILTLGSYGQFSYTNKANKFNASLGGRVDYNTIQKNFGYGSVFNPRVALIYYPGKFIFKTIYAEAFEDASSQNKFSTVGTRLLNNPSLKPEKVKNLDISGRFSFSKNGYIEATYYNSQYSNILGTVNVVMANGTPTTQFQPVGEARMQGVQMAAEYNISQKLSLFANATTTNPQTVVKSKVTKEDSTLVRIGDIAKYSLNAGVNYSLFHDRLNFNLRTNYVSDKLTGKKTTIAGNPYSQIDGYVLLHGSVFFKFTQGILLQFNCNNITDKLYYSPGVRTGGGNYASRIPQMGRSFYLRLILEL